MSWPQSYIEDIEEEISYFEGENITPQRLKERVSHTLSLIIERICEDKPGVYKKDDNGEWVELEEEEM